MKSSAALRAASPGWNDDRREAARSLWIEGQTAAEIMNIIGGKLSRNAVIGFCHRQGLKRAQVTPPVKTKLKAPAVRRTPYQHAGLNATKANPKAPPQTKAQLKPAPAPPILVGGEAQGVTLMALGKGCKWPLAGDGADLLFCGCARPDDASYCAKHAAQAYSRKSEQSGRPIANHGDMNRLAKLVA